MKVKCLQFIVNNNYNHVIMIKLLVIDPCNESDGIRLTQVESEVIGRLEMCSSGIWGTVCGNGATDDVATVACRELNHAASGI